jgi:hypothetical protein
MSLMDDPVWSTGGMILTGHNLKKKKPVPVLLVPIKNLTGLESNPGPRGERLAT